MSAQGREWQPGDKAFLEVEVSHMARTGRHVWITSPFGGKRWVDVADLRPVPAGGEVEAAVRLVVGSTALGVEQAREYLTAALELVRAGEVEAATEDAIDDLRVAMLGTTDGDFIDPDSDIPAGEMFRLAAEWVTNRLLAGGVPGRSEAEIKAEALNEAAAAITNNTFAQPGLVADWLRDRAARVAGTTDTEGGE